MTTRDIGALYSLCGYPQASPSETAAWTDLKTGADGSNTISIGIFGYDISCLASMCATFDYEDGTDSSGAAGYCGLIEARGLDGLAFGGEWSSDSTSTEYYCAGFRNNEGGRSMNETMVCTTAAGPNA